VIGRYREGTIRWMTPDDGIPVVGVYSMLDDGLGGLWIGGPDAIGRVRLDSVGRLESGAATRLERWRFGAADGVKIPNGREFPFPSSLRTKDGRLWFATLDGVAMCDPARLRAHRTNVPPIFESIGGGDGREEAIWGDTAGVRLLPAGTRDLRVRYTATLFGDPDQVEFEYRVERPGAGWLPGPDDRLVLMTDLSAGEHSVAVRSRLVGDPEWSAPVVMHFDVGWFWWERPGVRWSGAAGGFVIVALVMWWGLERHYRRKRAALARESELKRLAQAKASAEAANRAKTEFIAMISHELRTPLHGLLGHVDLLRDASLTPAQTGYLRTVRQSGEALLRVINEVLDYSRLETGRLDLDPEAFVLRKHLSATMDLMTTGAAARGLAFVCRVDPELPEVVEADSHRIHQVLVNLTANAIKFTRSGHVWVTVSACNDRPGLAEFRVEDSGIGIAPEDLPKLFQKFTQVDTSTTRHFGGTGLGLAICKGLVERMGGEIGCQSEPGKGSAFWFRIPLPQGELLEPEEAGLTGAWRLHEFAVVGMDEMTAGAVESWVKTASGSARGTRHRDLVSAENWLRQPGVGVEGGATVFLDWSVVEGDPRFAIRSLRNATRRTTVRLVVLLGGVPVGTEQGAGEWGCDFVWRQPYLAPPVPVHEVAAVEFRTKPASKEMQPREAEPRAVPTASTVPVGRGAAEMEAGRKKRVLLVEDHPVNQAYAREALMSLGCLVDLANNGREAVELARTSEYDLVLMDCQMPELDGWEATRQIRASERPGQRQYIVALTAGAYEGDRERCMASGMDEFLTKPFRILDLKRLLERRA
jgi:signal transduction histidine kinase/ActR/RegA family two-component response regulator